MIGQVPVAPAATPTEQMHEIFKGSLDLKQKSVQNVPNKLEKELKVPFKHGIIPELILKPPSVLL